MSPLRLKTYELLKKVPLGYVTTYKALAHALNTKAYRVIGQYMRTNPFPYMTCHDEAARIPCHRVVSNGGDIGGFMGRTSGKAIQQKIRLLKSEGVTVQDAKIVNFHKLLYSFTDFSE